jgi:hypothetical protein
MRLRFSAAVLLLASGAVCLDVSGAAWGAPGGAATQDDASPAAVSLAALSVPGGASVPESARPPDHSKDPEVVRLWAQGLRCESEGDFLASSRAWEPITEKMPNESHPYWRIARNYLRYAQELPATQPDEQYRYYSLTEQWADRGLAVDPDCGECCLYKFAGLGKRLAVGSVISAARRAAELAKLLDRAMALRPSYRDNDWNSELGNLYYAAAAFYRVLPEWRWLGWVIGVRGDKRRALDYIRKANEISTGRVDYQVALGATLLCVGVDKNEPDLVGEGTRVLGRVASLPVRLESDPYDRKIAAALLSRPQRACGYTHHDWIDIDKEMKHG